MPRITATVRDSQGNTSTQTKDFAVQQVDPGDFDRVVTGPQPSGFTVPAGQTWKIGGLVETPANVVVRGMLVMRPGDTLRFTGVNQAAFVGGETHMPQASDVGLWVQDMGRADFQGTPKLSWAKANSDLTKGQRAVTLAEDPVGWNVGDELVICPTRIGANLFDEVTVAAISGRTVTLNRGLTFSHPSSNIPGIPIQYAEVLNMTRDVRVEGTPGARAHCLWNHGTSPQVVKNAAFKHLGPEKNGKTVTGRYPMHFHHMMDGSKGSVVDGCVVSHSRARAFVPHMSHGMSFTKCVAYNVANGAYWWDPPAGDEPKGDPTHDLLWEDCVAAKVVATSNTTSQRDSAFHIGGGQGNVIRRCVAVGIMLGGDGAGYLWPSNAGNWVNEDNICHESWSHGIFNWHNAGRGIHTTTRFLAYRCGGAGISQGAYLNSYRYVDPILSNNNTHILLHAVSAGETKGMLFLRAKTYGGGQPITTARHRFPSPIPTQFVDCEFSGYSAPQALLVSSYDPTTYDVIDFVRCKFTGNELWIGDDGEIETVIRFQDSERGNIAVKPTEVAGGELVPEWNGKRFDIAPFA